MNVDGNADGVELALGEFPRPQAAYPSYRNSKLFHAHAHQKSLTLSAYLATRTCSAYVSAYRA